MNRIKNIALLLITFAFVAQVSASEFKLEGRYLKGKKYKVYLCQENNNKIQKIDSTVVSTNGSYRFTGTTNCGTQLYYLLCQESMIPVLLDKAVVNIDIENKQKPLFLGDKLKGCKFKSSSPTEEQLALEKVYQYICKYNALGEYMMHLDRNNSNAFKQCFELYGEYQKELEVVTQEANQKLALVMLIRDFLIKNSPEKAVAVYDSLPRNVLNEPMLLQIKEQISRIKASFVGGTAPNFTLSTPDGASLSLYQLRGKYVILDFWASWCAPCMKEMEHLKQIYQNYSHDKLEILGVSADEKADAWKSAIINKGLTWKHVSSLKGAQCPVSKEYVVSGIPCILVISPEGKVLKRYIRGKALEDFIEQCLK